MMETWITADPDILNSNNGLMLILKQQYPTICH